MSKSPLNCVCFCGHWLGYRKSLTGLTYCKTHFSLLGNKCVPRDKKRLLLIDFAPRESSEQIKNMIWILKLVPLSICQMYQCSSKQSRSNSLYRPTWILKFCARGIEGINTIVTSTCRGLWWIADEEDECLTAQYQGCKDTDGDIGQSWRARMLISGSN